MHKALTFAALMFFGVSSAAHASIVDVTLGNTSADPLTFGSTGALNPNVNLGTASLVLTGDASLETTSSPPTFVAPTGTLFGGNYLAVIADPGPPGSATFTLAANQNTFGFTWGTIDNFNTLKLTDSRAVTYTITGTDILGHILGSIDGTTQSDVSFNDPFGQIVNAQLLSTGDSFEVANVSETSSVPLPDSLPLFGAAFLALLFVGYQRRAKARAQRF